MPPGSDVYTAVLKLGSKWGPWTALALSLVGVLVFRFDNRLADVERKIDAHQAAMENEAKARLTFEAERRANERITAAILRGICIGTSGDIPHARALCDMQREP
jgi:hypothetical protein